MAQTHNTYLSKADSLFEAGQRKAAQTFYQKAAAEGSAEAHFALGYRYVISREGRRYHYVQAARQGHEKALGNALELLLFRSASLTKTEPKRALDLYHQAKKANPDLELYNEAETVKIMKMAAATADFDGTAFRQKFKFDSTILSKMYGIWQLAEKASLPGSNFGKPNPKLVLSLVVRGSIVPAEKMGAIKEVYKNYKNGTVKPFHICEYITSGSGMAFCASRANIDDRKQRLAKLDSLKQILGTTIAPLLQKAYSKAVAFIEAKAVLEEYHGGSGRRAWILSSEMEQKHQFLALIDSIQNGFKPPNLSFSKTDHKLNKAYQKALGVLNYDERPFQYFTKPKDLRKVQRLWIPFRDAAANAFHAMQPEVKLNAWKAWLTKQRIEQLRQIPGMKE